MIVHRSGPSLDFISQPDHAALARRIMERLPALAAHPRAEAILLAVGGHDNGWSEEDAALSVDAATGDVLDFIRLPTPRLHDVWRRGISRLGHDPCAAALVAHHGIFVYDRHRGKPEWEPFFAELDAVRSSRIAESRGTLAELEADYAYLRLGDLISLAFCTRSEEPSRFRDWTVERRGDRVVVTPDVFAGAVVDFEIEARRVDARRFSSDADLREALAAAPTIVLRGAVGA